MAVVFGNLNSASGLKKLDEYLLNHSYITGYEATKDDLTVYAAIANPPSPDYMNVARWFNHVTALLKSSGVSEEETGVIVKYFATEELVCGTKSGKSSVVMDIKPWDDETNMKKFEEVVRSVEMEGLTWGASKLVPVGYGMNKLQIMLTIVDDLVSVDNDLIDDVLTVEPINEYVQSCDIVIFNKI